VIEAEGALPPARRRRRRPKRSTGAESLPSVAVTTVTMIRAHRPFEAEHEASAWLDEVPNGDTTDSLLAELLAALDRALAAEAAATGRAYVQAIGVEDVLAARIGYADGDRASDGLFLEALDIDARGGTASPRRERLNRTRPLARIAAILGETDAAHACEFLVPRLRADLDGGRILAAALTVEVAVRATIRELDLALDDPDHGADLDRLEELLPDLSQMTDSVLAEGEAWPGLAESLEEPVFLAERVMRRRRVLEQ
jgi:integrase